MDISQLKNDIFDANHPEKQYRAVYQMRYVQGDSEVVHILFRACYEARNSRLQQEAVRSLGVLKPGKALDAFTKSTYNPDTDKRRRAFYHLGTLGNPRAIDVVLRGLTDPDETVRRAAAIAAGRLGHDYRVINALNQLLNGFEPESVKSAASRSIEYVRQRLNSSGNFNYGRSFNREKRPGFRKSAIGKGFNKIDDAPKTYTPKGF